MYNVDALVTGAGSVFGLISRTEKVLSERPSKGKMTLSNPVVRRMPIRIVTMIVVGTLLGMHRPATCDDSNGPSTTISPVQLTKSHIEASDRQRRIEAINLKILSSYSTTEIHDPKQFEVRINNLLLGDGQTEEFVRRPGLPIVLSGALRGWLTCPVKPDQVALGDNIVGVRVIDRLHDSPGQIVIEKLELHVQCR
jgi:hypothetical protein